MTKAGERLGREAPPLIFPAVPPNAAAGAGSAPDGGSGGLGDPPGSGSSGGTSGGPTSSGGSGSWIDPDPAPSGWNSVYCGDWARDVETEECDAGPDGPFDACTANCQTRDFLLFPASEVSSPEERRAVRLGNSPHQVAATELGLGVVVMYPDEQEVAVRLLDARGTRGAQISLGTGTSFADPSIGALGDSLYVAWNDLNGDGSELGVALRRVNVSNEEVGPLVYANTTTLGAQFGPDVVSVGTSLVVAWTDTSNPASGPDVVMRRFDSALRPLSGEIVLGGSERPEGNVALASYAETLGAAWRESQPDGSEVVVVWVDGRTWRLNVGQPGPATERPTLAFLDAEHVFVAYTTNTDPESTGVSNIPRLFGALVDLNESAAFDAGSIVPLHPAYAGEDLDRAALGQYRPRLSAAGDHLYLAWQSAARLGDESAEELWLKRLYWDPASEQVALGVLEQPIPRSDVHRRGDQREMALAGTPLAPEGALLLAWTDYGVTLDLNQGYPDVVLQLAPLPIRRGDVAEKNCAVGCEGGEGPCEPDVVPSQCEAGTTCVMGRGPWYGYGPRTPVCVPNHCLNGVEDASETETGVDCGGECGPCFSCYRDAAGAPELSQLGTSGFCSAVCRCESTEGDCNSDTDCASGLECMQNVGDQHIPQYPPEIDLCVSPSCVSEGIILCGVPGCSSCPAGHVDYCQHQTCGEGEGDCDGDEQCGPGLYCATGAGGLYGAPGGVDVCRPLACASSAAQPNTSGYCTTECRCGTGTGVCTSDAQCLAGSVCSAEGLSYGRYPELAVCTPEHCTNGLRDGDERRVDCGGSCGDCSLCETNEEFASFEDPERPWGWAPDFAPSAQVSMAQSGTVTHGSASLEVTACGWADLMSGGHSTADLGVVGNELWLDLFIPGTVPNAAYVGRLSLSVSVPGAGIEDWRLEALTTNGLAADHGLTALPRGAWSKLRFQVPETVQAAYHRDWESARFRIGLSTAPCASGVEPSFLLDHLRFGGAEAAFRSVCNQPNVTPTSLAENFSFEQLEVWRDAFGGPSVLTPEREHVAHLIQAARVPHNQTVVVRSGHFTAGDIGASNRLRLDVRLPSPASGSVTGSITATGACHGVAPVNLGSQTLSGRPLDAYSTLAFTVPSSFQSVLAGNYSQCSITLSITSAGLDEPLSIDNLRFGAPAFCEDNQLSDVAPFALNQPVTPNGTATYPYPLCTAAQFQTLVNTTSLWNKHFVLKGDVDLSTLVGQIGTSTTPFTGTLNGGGHELQNYVLEAPGAAQVGLFGRKRGGFLNNLRIRNFRVVGGTDVGALVGYLELGGRLENVHVVGGSVTGTILHVGGLLGRHHGVMMSDCSSSATILGTSGAQGVGGLVGNTGGNFIVRSSASGTVTSTGPNSGGLLGEGGGAVVDSFATGEVVSSASNVGGLVGQHANAYGSVTRSYATGRVVGNQNVGGLVGMTYGSITQSYATNVVEASAVAGGLVGRTAPFVHYTTRVLDSFATGAVTTRSGMAGGLVGLTGSVKLERSFAAGNVTAGTIEAGGLVGYATDASLVADSFSSGIVTAAGVAGGLIGRLWKGASLERSYALSQVSSTGQRGGLVGAADLTVAVSASFFDASVNVGLGAVGTNNVSGVSDAGKTTEELQQRSLFEAAGWNFNSVWKMAGNFPSPSTISFCEEVTQENTPPFQSTLQPPPDGTAENPYRLCTPEQMQTLANSPGLWDKVFILATDIDLSTVTGSFGHAATPFSGTFDGRGRRLRDYVRTGTSDVGLFGLVVGDGELDGVTDGHVKDLWVEQPTVVGNVNVGGLVGRIENGVVENIYSNHGSVSAATTGVSESIGGLVGAATGSIIRNSTSSTAVAGRAAAKVGGLAGSVIDGRLERVRTYSVTLTVTQGGQAVGGLAGTASTVMNSTANGTLNLSSGTSMQYVGGLVGVALGSISASSTSIGVNAPNATHVGGLVGWSMADIDKSYATGAVSGSRVGGLVGFQEGGELSRSYATGAVTAGSTGVAGGLVGEATAATITDSYATGLVTMAAAPSGGGLVGVLNGTSVAHAYALGAVSGTHSARGGFIGTTEGSPVSFVSGYYGTASTPGLQDIGQDLNGTGTNPAAISAVSDTALKTQSTFTGWDFVNVWNITSGNYPVLR